MDLFVAEFVAKRDFLRFEPLLSVLEWDLRTTKKRRRTFTKRFIPAIKKTNNQKKNRFLSEAAQTIDAAMAFFMGLQNLNQ